MPGSCVVGITMVIIGDIYSLFSLVEVLTCRKRTFQTEIVIWICEVVNSEFQGCREFGNSDTDGYHFLYTIDHPR